MATTSERQYRVFVDGEEKGGWAHESCAQAVEQHYGMSVGGLPANRPSNRQLTCLYCDMCADGPFPAGGLPAGIAWAD